MVDGTCYMLLLTVVDCSCYLNAAAAAAAADEW